MHVVLRQGGWIEGRVIEEDRTPVRGARIELAATHGALEKVAYAADDGTFTFASAPDEVLLSVSRPESPGDVGRARHAGGAGSRPRAGGDRAAQAARRGEHPRRRRPRLPGRSRRGARRLARGLRGARAARSSPTRAATRRCPTRSGLALRFTLVRPGKAPLVQVVEGAPAQARAHDGEGIEGRGQVTARDGRDRVAGADLTIFTPSGARHARTDARGRVRRARTSPRAACASPRSHPDYAPGRGRGRRLAATAITPPTSAPSTWPRRARWRARWSTPTTTRSPAPASRATPSRRTCPFGPAAAAGSSRPTRRPLQARRPPRGQGRARGVLRRSRPRAGRGRDRARRAARPIG